jgi:Cu(I)/Ag(I) efflux system membrane fusion protein
VSPDELKAAEAAVEQAFALAELARMRLRDATVTAPIAGVVVELQATPGNPVGPTAPIMTLIPPEYQVMVQADEDQAAHLQIGQSVTLSVETLPQDSFSGIVKAIAPVLDPRTRTVAVRVEIPDPRNKLRPGMFA